MKYLLYGHGGAYNHGAEAILQTTMAGIHEINTKSSVLLSSHFPQQDKEFGIRADVFLSHNMDYLEKEKEECKPNGPDGRYNKQIYQSTIEMIDKDTLALSVGGDNYCYPVWHRWKCIHEEVLKQGGKDVLWSCSINPEAISRDMKETLASHYRITARESITYDALRNLGLNNVALYADVAFLLEPKRVVLPNNFLIGNTVAINVSPLVMRREKEEGIVKSAVLEMMTYILQKTDMNIALVPHVVMPMDNDFVALSEIFKEFKGTKWEHRICLCSDKMSAAEYKYIISRCRFGVFTRTHASIAAYSSGVPTLVLGYSVKARGIAKDMGVGEYVLDIANLNNANQLRKLFERLWSEEARIKEIVDEKAVKMKCLAREMFTCLRITR